MFWCLDTRLQRWRQEVSFKVFIVEPQQRSGNSGCWLGEKYRWTHWRSTEESEAQDTVAWSAGVSKAWAADHLALKWSLGQAYKCAAGVPHCLAVWTRPLLHTQAAEERGEGEKQRAAKTQTKHQNTNHDRPCLTAYHRILIECFFCLSFWYHCKFQTIIPWSLSW